MGHPRTPCRRNCRGPTGPSCAPNLVPAAVPFLIRWQRPSKSGRGHPCHCDLLVASAPSTSRSLPAILAASFVAPAVAVPQLVPQHDVVAIAVALEIAVLRDPYRASMLPDFRAGEARPGATIQFFDRRAKD